MVLSIINYMQITKSQPIPQKKQVCNISPAITAIFIYMKERPINMALISPP